MVNACARSGGAEGTMMRVLGIVALLAGVMMAGPVRAQAPAACPNCAASAACDDQRDNCVAECRAGLFVVDPRQAACIAKCTAAADNCAQSADAACRADKTCR